MSQIASLVRQLSGRTSPTLTLCTVTQVDRSSRTVDCQPLDESAPILGVSLQGDSEGEGGLLLLPKVGAYVIVGFVDGQDTGAVLLTDELDALELKIGAQTLVVTEEGITFNGGKLGGVVKIEALTKQLNTLEQDINTLKTALSAWVPIPTDGGAALKGAIAAWSGQILQPTQRTTLEDKKVKH